MPTSPGQKPPFEELSVRSQLAITATASVLALATAVPAGGQELTGAWRVGGFATPESVSYGLVAGRTAGVASRRVKVAAGQGMLDN